MNEKMYKYFCDNNLLTHGIGEISEKETYYKFESIIKYGGLMSMQRLKNEGIIAPNVCAEYLDKIQKMYGYNLPIYDFDFNITNNLELDTNKRVK